jgi:hypothetical protein
MRLPQRRPMMSPSAPNSSMPAATQKCIGKSEGGCPVHQTAACMQADGAM